ncbi:MAG: biopolymer transporter ExbD [Gemmatimonadota bacterium]|jgi:biopolymer transport protein ExbD|nr:biopolymer transporter ExbD [Gemmatimonadota bacterium]
MGMSAGGSKGGVSADINITPMIDILLVLLIIFMVVQQEMQKGLSVQVPPLESEVDPSAAPPDQIVLEVLAGGRFLLNSDPLTKTQLQPRITQVFAPRPRKVIFLQGAEDATYGDIAYAVDVVRASGVEVVGLIPRR